MSEYDFKPCLCKHRMPHGIQNLQSFAHICSHAKIYRNLPLHCNYYINVWLNYWGKYKVQPIAAPMSIQSWKLMQLCKPGFIFKKRAMGNPVNRPFANLYLVFYSRLYNKIAYPRCAPMYGKCCLLSIERRRWETTFPVHWSVSRVSNLIVQPWFYLNLL